MGFFAASDGAKLYFSDSGVAGAGVALLCLAGLTRNSRDFDALAPHMAHVRLITMDYRGRGQSEWTGADTYTIAQEAADVLALLDHLGLKQVAILGTSRGGLIAMALAVMAPERLMGVCLNDIGPVMEPDALARIGTYVGRPPVAQDYEAAAHMLARNARGVSGVPLARWHQEARHHYAQNPDGPGLVNRYDPELRQAFLAAVSAPAVDLWPFFDALAGRPLATIRGVNSDILSYQTLLAMRARRPDMLWCDLPGRAHVPFLDEPDALFTLHRFLEQIAWPPPQ
jgi:pimeloyl-ACP methyl ester carboxylesterase